MKYTDSHEWVEIQGDEGIVGISSYALKELGEIVYIELPSMGSEVNAGDEVAVLESTKAAADIYAPISGTILAVNERLKNDPTFLNSSPEKEGWLFKIAPKSVSELDRLLDAGQYLQLIS